MEGERFGKRGKVGMRAVVVDGGWTKPGGGAESWRVGEGRQE